jgi:hypothetical protein
MEPQKYGILQLWLIGKGKNLLSLRQQQSCFRFPQWGSGIPEPQIAVTMQFYPVVFFIQPKLKMDMTVAPTPIAPIIKIPGIFPLNDHNLFSPLSHDFP